MFTLSKDFKFEASHVLEGHDGKCARLHGHSWVARVVFEGQEVAMSGPKMGMVVDYGNVKAIVQPLVDNFLDHHHLNETLGTTRPTSEYVAFWLFSKINGFRHALPQGVALKQVTVFETCTSACTYYENS